MTFRSTPPREGRPSTWAAIRITAMWQRFDPRPHARGDADDSVTIRTLASRKAVSIHAPTRGATHTAIRNHGADLHEVSIHAPTRGATRAKAARRSRLCHRGQVSIHAPTRGATRRCRRLQCPGDLSMFRSTPPREGRRRRTWPISIKRCRDPFRSTPPREGRRHVCPDGAGRDDLPRFRSTPPREGRRRAALMQH